MERAEQLCSVASAWELSLALSLITDAEPRCSCMRIQAKLRWVHAFLQGRSPSLNSVMSCKRMLLHSPNLRHMIDLESQLQQSDMPADVSRSLVDLLQVCM